MKIYVKFGFYEVVDVGNELGELIVRISRSRSREKGKVRDISEVLLSYLEGGVKEYMIIYGIVWFYVVLDDFVI